MQAPATAIAVDDMRSQRALWRTEGRTVAFVPTMGALHAGHLELVKRARQEAERVVVSIFVNPSQFGPSEDFAKYPRTLKEDIALLTGAADFVFLPNATTMYPPGYQTWIQNDEQSAILCGASRPGHFRGVLTVVMKLFNIVQPEVALFGKKDYQQWRMIEKMVRDLDASVRVLGVDTKREADGMAMSSRNRYLSADERQTAARISAGLRLVAKLVQGGERKLASLVDALRETLQSGDGLTIEYAEVRRQSDLSAFGDAVDAPAVALVAARVGSTRLIDNMELG